MSQVRSKIKSQLIATVTLRGKIRCITGLHIGSTDAGYEIGGMENAVIRNPYDGFPYIPGASLKGKLRSLLEWFEGEIAPDGEVNSRWLKDDIKNEQLKTKAIQKNAIYRIFGAPADLELPIGPTRLIVRDAFPDEETRIKMDELEEKQGLPKVEIKTEVTINRITSKANPRKQERVPEGSCFDFEMVYFLYDVSYTKNTPTGSETTTDTQTTNRQDVAISNDVDFIKSIFLAMRLLEESSLGGSGSRGYGQVKFYLREPIVLLQKDYLYTEKPPENKTEQLESEVKDLSTDEKNEENEENSWILLDNKEKMKEIISNIEERLRNGSDKDNINQGNEK